MSRNRRSENWLHIVRNAGFSCAGTVASHVPEYAVLKGLLQFVHGIDYESGAIELAAFSLCLALCDALEPEAIRATIKLFPQLAGNTLHASCFFAAKVQNLITAPVGAVLGNPPSIPS